MLTYDMVKRHLMSARGLLASWYVLHCGEFAGRMLVRHGQYYHAMSDFK